MRGSLTIVRALLAATVTTLLALCCHLGAGGLFSPLGTVVVFILVLWVATILAGRRLGFFSLALILGLGQVLMHLSMLIFSAGGMDGHQPASVSSGVVGTADNSGALDHSDHHLHALDPGWLFVIPPAQANRGMSASDMGGGFDMPMLGAHCLAVVVTALVLTRGEDALLRILQLALGPGAIAFLRTGAVTQVPLLVIRWVQTRLFVPHVRMLIGPSVDRGPPVLL